MSQSPGPAVTAGAARPRPAVLPGRPAGPLRQGARRRRRVILDLEDGVGADGKDAARGTGPRRRRPGSGAGHRPGQRRRNRGARGGPRDAARRPGTGRSCCPRRSAAQQLDALAEWQVVALCETPRGILRAADIAAAPNVVALMWGAEDLIAALGGRTAGARRAVPGRRPARPVSGAARGRRPRRPPSTPSGRTSPTLTAWPPRPRTRPPPGSPSRPASTRARSRRPPGLPGRPGAGGLGPAGPAGGPGGRSGRTERSRSTAR